MRAKQVDGLRKRVNLPIGSELYNWLVAESEKLQVPVTAFIVMSLDQVRTQRQVASLSDAVNRMDAKDKQ